MKKRFLSIGNYIAMAIFAGVALLITFSITTLIDVAVVIFQAREARYYKFIDETKGCKLQEKVTSKGKFPTRLVYDCDGVRMVWEK